MNLMFHGPAYRAIRDRHGYRAVDLAEKLGISSSYLNHIESGRKQPPKTLMQRMALELGLTLREVTYSAEVINIDDATDEEEGTRA